MSESKSALTVKAQITVLCQTCEKPLNIERHISQEAILTHLQLNDDTALPVFFKAARCETCASNDQGSDLDKFADDLITFINQMKNEASVTDKLKKLSK